MNAKQVFEPTKQPKIETRTSLGFWETTKIFTGKAVKALLIFLLTLLIMAYIASGSDSASRSADKVIEYLQVGECSKIFELTSDNFVSNTNETEWGSYCGEVSQVLTGNVDRKSTNIVVDAESVVRSGVVKYEIVGSDKAVYEVYVEMIEDDTWKLDVFDFKVLDRIDSTTTDN